MSKSVDERVVQMKFDNKQFEQGVNQTMSTLDKFKQKLNLTGASKALDSVQKSAQDLNKVSLSNIENSLSTLEKRFSTLGIVGITVIQDLTNSLLGLAKQAFNFTIGGITNGGLTRAMNLENAKFQLQGLLKEASEIDDVMSDVNYGVLDTAYSLDAAAGVASQLVASGIKAGDTMRATLRGISGVAAMTNSTYEDIGSIYTRISGQGRVMAIDLNSLAARGLNAAAVLAESMGTTEAEVRKMVSKGQISFEKFSKAMDDAFGAHAKEANRTFNGAMSNIRAALAKIGAEFYQPIIAMDGPLVQLLNAIREKINDFKADILPFVKELSTSVGSVITNIADNIKSNNKFKYNPFSEEDPNTHVKTYVKTADKLQEISRKTGLSIEEIENNIEKLNTRFLIFNSIKNIGQGVISVFKAIGKAFNEVFGGKAEDSLFNIAAGFNKISSIIKDKLVANSEKIYNTFKGVFSVLSFGINVIKGIATVIGNLIGSLFGVTDGLLGVTSAFGKWINEVYEGIKRTDAFNIIIKKLGEFVKNFMQGLKDFLHGFIGTFGAIISSVARTIGSALKQVFNALGRAISSGDAAKFMDVLNKGLFAMVLLKIKNFINYLGKGGTLFDTLKRFTGSLKNIADNIAGVLNSVKGALKAWQHDLEAKTLIKIATAVGILALALVTLSDIRKDKLETALTAITTLFINLVAALKILAAGNFVGSFKKTTMAIGLAMSVLILASALKKISGINTEDMVKSILAIGVLTKLMSSVVSDLSRNDKKAIKGAAGIIALALGIKILASTCKIFAAMNWEEMARGLVGVGVLLGELWGFIKYTDGKGKRLITVGLSTIVLATGLKILASVCKTFSEFSWESIGKGLTAVGGLLAELAIFSSQAKNFKKTISTGIALNIIALAIKQMVNPFMTIAELSWDEIIRGLAALGGIFTILTLSIRSLTEIASKGGFWGGINMNFAAMSIEMLTKLLGKIVEAFKGFSSISWEGILKSLLSIALSMGILISATEKLETKNIAAIIASALALNILAKSIALLGNMGLEGVAVGLLGIAGVFTILTVSMKFLIPMAKGIMKVAGSIALLSGSLALLGISIGVVGAGFGIFATSLIATFAAFSLIGWETIAKGLISIAGAFIIIGVAAKVLRPLTLSILSLAFSISVFSLSVAAVGVGISLIVQAFATLAAVGKDGAETAGAAFKALITSFIELIPVAVKQIGLALKELLIVVSDIIPLLGNILIKTIHMLVEVLVTCAPDLARGFFETLVQTLSIFNEYIPQIANLIFDMLINILNTLSIRLPELVTAVINFLVKLFDAVVEVFKDFGPDNLLKAVVTLGVLSVVLKLMAGLAHIVPQAMIGILAFGVLVTELSAVLAAVGALSRIPGFKELVTDSGHLLQAVGTAIGQFVGGIIGGVAKGVTSVLPDIATNLSNFMTNLQPFIEGAKSIDGNMLDKVTMLAASMIELYASGFVASVTSFLSWLTGNSLASLGTQLSDFMNNASGFIKGLNTITPDMLNGAKVLSAIITATKDIPRTGGLKTLFEGSNDLGLFGIKLEVLGKSLNNFITSLGENFGEKEINMAVSAAKCVSEIAKAASNIPKTGGLKTLFEGDNDISKFGSKLPNVGECIAKFVEKTKNLTNDNVNVAKTAAEILTTFASVDVPSNGGLKELFDGDRDISKYADKLPHVGFQLALFIACFRSLGNDQIQAAKTAAEVLTTFASVDVPVTSGGLAMLFEGEKDISKYADKLPHVAYQIARFTACFKVAGFGQDQLQTAKTAAEILATFASVDVPVTSGGLAMLFEGEKDISKYADKLPHIAYQLVKFTACFRMLNKDQIEVAKSAADLLTAFASVDIPTTTSGLGAIFDGSKDISKYVDKLPHVAYQLVKFAAAFKYAGISKDQLEVVKMASDILTTFTSIDISNKNDNIDNLSNYVDNLPHIAYQLIRFAAAFKKAGIMKEDIESASNVLDIAKSINEVISSDSLTSEKGKDIEEFSSCFISFANRLNEALGSLKLIDAEELSLNLQKVKEFSESVKDLETVLNVLKSINEVISSDSLTAEKGKDIEEFASCFISFGNKLNEALGSLKLIDAEELSSNLQKIKETAESASTITAIDNNKIESFATSFKQMGSEGLNSFKDSLSGEEAKTLMVNAIETIITKVKEAIEKDSETIKSSFNDVGEKAYNGLNYDENRGNWRYWSFYNLGKNFVEGFANGISENSSLANIAARSLGNKAVEQVQAAIDSHSPSKKTEKLGKYFGQGFVLGIDEYTDKTKDAAKEMGNAATQGLNKAISKVYEALNSDIDTQPTIRPVLDLSDIESGAKTLNSMLDMNNVMLDTNLGSISTSINRRLQNGRSNSDVISAIDSLSKTLGNTQTGNTYNINGIQYSEGSDVSEAINTLMRAITVERRI